MAALSSKKLWIGIGLAGVLGVVGWKLLHAEKHEITPAVGKPALTVVTATLQPAKWMRDLTANGSVVAWQEAIIGSEVSGVRVSDVRVSVGDRVVKGQTLATLAVDTMAASEAESQAALKESEAVLLDAGTNAARIRKLATAGFVSNQQLEQALTTEKTARARMEVQRARHQSSAVRLAQQRITAPDSGVISARSATVGALTQPGAELFRLIRQGRLEWHADVAAEELSSIKKGMKVALFTAQGTVQGVVRAISPTINPQTRYGQVLVDLPASADLVAGMFAKGTLLLGEQAVMVLPQSAVLLRDNAAYVFVVGPDAHVRQQKIVAGQRQGNQIEIQSGLEQGVQVVESGAAFLVEGDVVRVTGKNPLPNPDGTTGHSTKASKDDARVAGHLPQAGEGANGSLREDSVK